MSSFITKKVCFLPLLISSFLFAQEDKVKVDLSSPYNTIYTHLYFLQPESYDEVKAAEVIYGETPEDAIDISIKIKQILDAKGLKVNMRNLPVNPKYQDTTSLNEIRSQYVLFPEQFPEIYLEKIKNQWYYSRKTSESVFKIYRQVFPAGTEFIKKIIPSIGHQKLLYLELWQYFGILLFISLGMLLFWIFNKLIFLLLKSTRVLFVKLKSKVLNKTLAKISRPSTILIVFYLIIYYIPILQFNIYINSFLIKGLEIGQIALCTYIFLQIVAILIEFYTSYTSKTKSKLDDQLAPILSRLLKFIVVFLGALKMLTFFGINTTTIIAGASIGGLAVALASQDTVKNLIGTLIIFLDKPFQIGDWIEGEGVEGTVEEVGFRSTRIRAVDTSVFTIPNSKLSEIVINNKGLRQYRRYQTKLGIRYDTPPVLIEAFVSGVRKIIELHPETLTNSYNVEFTGFGDSALEILVNTYFVSLEWGVEQSSKHRLHIAIIKLASDLGVDFAFPSQTLMIEQFPEKNIADQQYVTDAEKIKMVLNKVKENFEAS